MIIQVVQSNSILPVHWFRKWINLALSISFIESEEEEESNRTKLQITLTARDAMFQSMPANLHITPITLNA